MTRERAEYGDVKVYDFFERSKNLSGDDLVKSRANYHKKCYSEFTNIEKLNRAHQRHNDALEQEKSTVVKRKAGRPSTSRKEDESEVRQLRSQSIIYDKNLCIICQESDGDTHKVETTETGKSMHVVANKIKNKDFFLRLNFVPNPEDCVANDVRYYLSCWAGAKKEAMQLERVVTESGSNVAQTLADIEIRGGDNKVIILDAMAIVNSIQIEKNTE